MKENRSIPIIVFTLIVIIPIVGCSKRAWYDGFKEGAKNNCRNQPESEMERCLENLNKRTYDEYEKDRSS